MNQKAENIQKIKDFSTLAENWNENGAQPFSFILIEQCLRVHETLPLEPSIFPTARGSIQFEYEKENGDYLEFELYENKVEVYRKVETHETEYTSTYEDADFIAVIERFM